MVLAIPAMYNFLHQLEKAVIPAKDILKWIMAPIVTKGAEVPVNMKGSFFLVITIKYPAEVPVVFCGYFMVIVQRSIESFNHEEDCTKGS